MSTFIEARITGPVLRNGRLYFSASLVSFFPADSFGARGRNGPHELPVTILAGADALDSDIRLSSSLRIGPGRSFARWLHAVRARERDRARLVRLEERRYRLELVA